MKSTKRSKTEKCEFCEGTLESRKVTVDSRRGGRLVVIEGVPARVCNRCGERYYPAVVVRKLEEISARRRTSKRIIRVPIARFGGLS